jgi:hypothetical protein
MQDESITGPADSDSDEDAAFEAAIEAGAGLPLREVLKREHDEMLKGRPPNAALEIWGDEIEAMILRDLLALKP